MTTDLPPVAPPASLSPSSISSFKSCPLSFRFAYLDRLPQPPAPHSSKGTLVHRALEHLYDRAPRDRTPDHALADLDRAWEELRDDPDFAGLELTDAEWASFHASARELVLHAFAIEDPTAVHPIGLELKLEATVGAVRLRGVIDRLERTPDGELVISDYKTGRVPGDRFVDQSLAGVRTYALLCEEVFGRRPSRVQLLYLAKGTTIAAEPTAQTLRGVARRTEALWDTIVRACERNAFAPKPSRLCDFCAFRPHCPAHGGDPAAALATPGAA